MCETHTFDLNRIFVFSEATIPGVQQYRLSMKDVQEAVGVMFQSIIPAINRSVMSAGQLDDERTLDKNQRDRVLREVGELVQGLFVADGRFAFADDGVTARTPYAQILNTFYVRVVMEAVYGARDWMIKRVPRDVFRFLSNARPLTLSEIDNPFLRQNGESDDAFRQRLEDLRVFQPNPLMELDPNRQWVPMHNWNSPDGYQLSDRIWRAGNETRRAIDELISQAFREGWSALHLAQQLEQYLLPGVGSASYYAMRLAQTEIARAANHAAYISAYLNPYVDRIDVARSPNGSHECPICPQFATIGIGGERLREPYSIHAANIPPFHPFCKDHCRPVLTDSPSTVTMRLQAVMDDARAALFQPSVNPAAAEALLQTLLHQSLNTIVAQFRGQFPLPGF